MSLVKLNIEEFVSLLSSKEPAPGGGSASALIGAIGVSLGSMVANLTIGKDKFKDKEPLMLANLKEYENLMKNLVCLMDQDTQAFNQVAEVFKMPKETEEQKAARKEAMQKALKGAARVPFIIMENTVSALRLHEKAIGNSNPSAISDIGVGALSLKTALQGAWLNVKINLNSIKDEAFVEEYETKSKTLLGEGTVLADRIYEAVIRNF